MYLSILLFKSLYKSILLCLVFPLFITFVFPYYYLNQRFQKLYFKNLSHTCICLCLWLYAQGSVISILWNTMLLIKLFFLCMFSLILNILTYLTLNNPYRFKPVHVLRALKQIYMVTQDLPVSSLFLTIRFLINNLQR